MGKGFYSNKDLKDWRETERTMRKDPNSLSDMAWKRRELMFATDPEAYEDKDIPEDNGHGIVEVEEEVDCPF